MGTVHGFPSRLQAKSSTPSLAVAWASAQITVPGSSARAGSTFAFNYRVAVRAGRRAVAECGGEQHCAPSCRSSTCAESVRALVPQGRRVLRSAHRLSGGQPRPMASADCSLISTMAEPQWRPHRRSQSRQLSSPGAGTVAHMQSQTQPYGLRTSQPYHPVGTSGSSAPAAGQARRAFHADYA